MRAVVLSFSLPPSTYATMLLRELTKQSTEITHQKGLNTRHAPDRAPEAPEAPPTAEEKSGSLHDARAGSS